MLAMEILGMPREILIEIIAFAACARGLKRALRLRLVCSQWDHLLLIAIPLSCALTYALSGF
jgi:hypothetical protein